MDKLISVGLKFRVALILTLRSTAIDTFAVIPFVFYALEDDIALWLVLGELICRKLTARELAAIHTAARKQAREFRNGNTKQLL